MVTVLIATHNGADTLPQMLESLCRLATGELDWRVVAVDNASTDDTPRILRSFSDRLPLTILEEKRRGKNHAMNCGLEAVRSDLVFCIDDDVVLSPGWMLALKRAFDAHPDFDIVCGPVEPLWPDNVPPWLLEVIPGAPAYTITPPGIEEGPCSPRTVFGPNMSFRMAIYRTGHRFNPVVGPDGSRFYAMGSETEFMMRVHATGHKAWFCRDARVQHIIMPIQLTRRWLWTRAMAFGRGDVQKVRRAKPLVDDAPRVLGIPRYALPLIARHALGTCAATLRGDMRAQYRALWKCGYTCGSAFEGWRESRGVVP